MYSHTTWWPKSKTNLVWNMRSKLGNRCNVLLIQCGFNNIKRVATAVRQGFIVHIWENITHQSVIQEMFNSHERLRYNWPFDTMTFHWNFISHTTMYAHIVHKLADRKLRNGLALKHETIRIQLQDKATTNLNKSTMRSVWFELFFAIV